KIDDDRFTLGHVGRIDEHLDRALDRVDLSDNEFGMGRELFAPFRRAVGTSDQGASVLFHH
ncbi:hypothetical protein ACC733_37750, partial [Rhizobium johnstonii]|uniref:hypothetical protein n=1 Tax=Rhizobium johnstonii TaxID=3019933 RepID=UPI003F99E4C0